ncbi:hypothetical protein [Nesterenkonia muleiensis]|nr:hypothetical protein [Nesterenkonia muleiensis]
MTTSETAPLRLLRPAKSQETTQHAGTEREHVDTTNVAQLAERAEV